MHQSSFVTIGLACIALFALPALLAAQGQYPPAPFVLTRIPNYTTSLFRMDRVAGCPGNGLEEERLFVQWQVSRWTDTTRNNSADTIRYEVGFIVDSAGGGANTFTVMFPADWNGTDPNATIPGDQVFERIFRPAVPYPAEPDTIVLRVKWFVRAWNSVGETYSDTGGVTKRSNPFPTSAIMMSYNRPPINPPTPVYPANNAVIGNITFSTPPIDIIWTSATDRNIIRGWAIGGFKVFNIPTQLWIDDPSGRTVDTLVYQWVGTVAHTAPAGTGAPLGTMLVRNRGWTTGFQLLPADLDMVFGGLNPVTAMTADTVVIDYNVYVMDFGTTNDYPLEEVTFRYMPDGRLRYWDSVRWSRFGCRPHELVSPTYRFTLVRTLTGIDDRPGLPDAFSLQQNYPNPFSPPTSIAYTLDAPGTVRLAVYNMLGAQVRTLVNGAQAAGTHNASWDGRDNNGRPMPAGVYLYRIDSRAGTLTRTMTLLR